MKATHFTDKGFWALTEGEKIMAGGKSFETKSDAVEHLRNCEACGTLGISHEEYDEAFEKA